MGRLGGILRPLGGILGPLGRILVNLGPSWRHLGAVLAHFGSVLGRLGGLEALNPITVAEVQRPLQDYLDLLLGLYILYISYVLP